MGGVGGGVDPWINDANAITWNAPGDEVIARALADRLKRHTIVDAAERTLGEPDRGGHRNRELIERRAPEEMWHQRNGPRRSPEGRIQRDLVDVLDEQVEAAGQGACIVAARVKRER